ncbi:hypothetical protein DRF57_08590 [Chryseobacterium rhizosphaerae]|uniref:Uncharacterized protein n=1 Tax=Chryseobacterium rhizosphaerae TaxID=395937 RepID=A0ABX9IM68_9FLAO|nr:hypothetical protein DRF57_08590 [Chryseobacterium rhizosphaerae]
MNFFIYDKDRKRFGNCKMYSVKCVNEGERRTVFHSLQVEDICGKFYLTKLTAIRLITIKKSTIFSCGL